MRQPIFVITFALITLCYYANSLFAHGKGHEDIARYGGSVLAIREYHLEFLALRNGEIKLFVTDLMGNPIDMSLAQGHVTLYPRSPEAQKLVLLEDETISGCLRARGKPLEEAETVVAAINIQIGEEKELQLEFWDVVKSKAITKAFSFLKK